MTEGVKGRWSQVTRRGNIGAFVFPNPGAVGEEGLVSEAVRGLEGERPRSRFPVRLQRHHALAPPLELFDENHSLGGVQCVQPD